MDVSKVTANGKKLTLDGDYYTGTIQLAGKEKLTADDKVTVLIEATWTDDGTKLDSENVDGYGLNADTLEGRKATQIAIPVTVLMQQYVV